MDPARRRQLEERRKFAQARHRAREWRARIEPAWSALEAWGDPFRIYGLGEEPQWDPAWIPAGYSRIPWHDLDGVGVREGIDDRGEMAAVIRELLVERLEPEAELLFVPDGTDWSIALCRQAFDAHAEALLEAAWDSAYVAAPPAQWLIHADWSEVKWKDG